MISDPITDKQREFIATLIETRDVDPEKAQGIQTQLMRGQNRRWASEIIESLMQRPHRVRQSQAEAHGSTLPDVPEGRYAVVTEPDGVVKFYKVDQGKVGTRWEGYTFVSVQGGPEDYPVKGFEQKQHILRLIDKDPRAALQRYGQLLGHCGVCGLPLTDETSREIGIGPICRGK